MNTQDSEREAFERWAVSKEGGYMNISRYAATGIYVHDSPRMAWDVWQAARSLPSWGAQGGEGANPAIALEQALSLARVTLLKERLGASDEDRAESFRDLEAHLRRHMPLAHHDNHHNALKCPYCNPRGLEFAEPAAPPAQPAEVGEPTDDVLEALDLRPDMFRTEGGAINQGKLRAAIMHPRNYLPPEHWLCGPQPLAKLEGESGITEEQRALMRRFATPVAHTREALRALASPTQAAQAEPAGMVLVPREPSIGRLMSMAIRSDHGFGIPGYYDQIASVVTGASHAQRLEAQLRHMRQIYEEAIGQGFYKPEGEEHYAGIAAASKGSAEG